MILFESVVQKSLTSCVDILIFLDAKASLELGGVSHSPLLKMEEPEVKMAI